MSLNLHGSLEMEYTRKDFNICCVFNLYMYI